MVEPPHPPLVLDKVVHVGDQVAVVIAETCEQAKDAAELIMVDYEELPAVTTSPDALKEGARWSTSRRRAIFALIGIWATRQPPTRHSPRRRMSPSWT